MERQVTLSTRLLVRVLVVVAVLALAIVAFQQRDRLAPGLFSRGVADVIDRTTYQAVFLTGGQLYFGRLEQRGESFYLLSDVYYLPPAADPLQQQPTQLIKRGNEIDGPQDPMIIPATAVLFMENMRPDSAVMVAIRRFKEGGPAPATTPAPTATPTASPRPSPSPTR